MEQWTSKFLGRTEELKKLHESWDLVQQGKPQIAVLLGETGLGKTRIIQEFYAQIASKQTYWPKKLNTGENLELQPKIDDPSLDIPWLWWGMRFSEKLRRNQLATISPFEKEDANLALNAEPILRKRKIKKTELSSALTLTTIVADILSLGHYGNIVATCEMIKEYHDLKKELCGESNDSTSEKNKNAELETVKKLTEKTLTTLRCFLDKSINDTPTVPVILVLDDAQWMDPVSLKALFLIFSEANIKNFPLMVLATHWEKEWNELNCEHKHLDFTQFRQFYEHVKFEYLADEKQSYSTTCIRIGLLKELQQIAQAALPGESAKIHKRLDIEADGNPRAMEEMLRLLLNRPTRHFVNGDPLNALNKNGLKKVAKLEKTDLYQKIMQRFNDLDDEFQDVLTTSSLFGMSFQRPVIIDLLAASKDIQKSDLLNPNYLLKDAEKIHALLYKISANGHSFQQKVYREVAHNYLKEEMECFYEELSDYKNEILRNWLTLDKLKELTENEQIQLCEFAFNDYLNSEDAFEEEDILSRAFAFENLTALLESNEDNGKISEYWQFIIENEEKVPSVFFCKLGHSINFLKSLFSHNTRHKETIIKIALESIHKLRRDNLTESESYAIWTINLAEILSEDYNNKESSISLAKESVHVRKSILNKLGETSERLSAIIFSLNSLGRILSKFDGYSKQSVKAYEESISINRHWLNRFKGNPDPFHNISDTLIHLGIIIQFENLDRAKEIFKESLNISQQVFQKFGKCPQASLNTSKARIHLGKIFIQENNIEKAREYFEQSISECWESIEHFGKNISMQLSLFDAFNHIREIAFDIEGDYKQQQQYYERCIEIHRKFVDRFGKTPSALCSISNFLEHIGDIALENESDHKLALKNYKESLIGRRELCRIYDLGEKYLFEVTYLLNKMGDTQLFCEGDYKQAIKYFEESLHAYRKFLMRFKVVPERYNAITVPIERLGDIALEYQSDIQQAKKYFEESLKIHVRTLNRIELKIPKRILNLQLLGKEANEVGEKEKAKLCFDEATRLEGKLRKTIKNVATPLNKLYIITKNKQGNEKAGVYKAVALEINRKLSNWTYDLSEQVFQ